MLKRKMLRGLKAAVYGGLIFDMLAGRKSSSYFITDMFKQ